MLGYIFHSPTNSIRERKRLKYEGVLTYKRTATII